MGLNAAARLVVGTGKFSQSSVMSYDPSNKIGRTESRHNRIHHDGSELEYILRTVSTADLNFDFCRGIYLEDTTSVRIKARRKDDGTGLNLEFTMLIEKLRAYIRRFNRQTHIQLQKIEELEAFLRSEVESRSRPHTKYHRRVRCVWNVQYMGLVSLVQVCWHWIRSRIAPGSRNWYCYWLGRFDPQKSIS